MKTMRIDYSGGATIYKIATNTGQDDYVNEVIDSCIVVAGLATLGSILYASCPVIQNKYKHIIANPFMGDECLDTLIQHSESPYCDMLRAIQNGIVPKLDKVSGWVADRDLPESVVQIFSVLDSLVNKNTDDKFVGNVPFVSITSDEGCDVLRVHTFSSQYTSCVIDGCDDVRWPYLMSIENASAQMFIFHQLAVPFNKNTPIPFFNAVNRAIRLNFRRDSIKDIFVPEVIANQNTARQFVKQLIEKDTLSDVMLVMCKLLGIGTCELDRIEKKANATAMEAAAFSKCWLAQSPKLVAALEAADEEIEDEDDETEEESDDPDEPTEEESDDVDETEVDDPDAVEEPADDNTEDSVESDDEIDPYADENDELGDESDVDSVSENQESDETNTDNNIEESVVDINTATKLTITDEETPESVLFKRQVQAFLAHQHMKSLDPATQTFLRMWADSFMWITHVNNTKNLLKLLKVEISDINGESTK